MSRHHSLLLSIVVAHVTTSAAVLCQNASTVQPVRDGQVTTVSPATGTVVGRVATPDGQALHGVRVSITANGRISAETLTDANGRYELVGIPFGAQRVEASKTGFVGLAFGQKRPYDAPRPVMVGVATIHGIDFVLAPVAVIVATITGEHNEPVSMLRLEVIPAELAMRSEPPLTAEALKAALSDDRGEIRVSNLSSGSYYVRASQSVTTLAGAWQKPRAYIDTYYPDAVNLEEAQTIEIKSGTTNHVSIRMITKRASTVSGRVLTSGGTKPTTANVSLGFRIGGAIGQRVVRVNTEGAFTVSNLSPGDYTVHAEMTTSDGTREVALHPLTVGEADISGLVVSGHTKGLIRGHFEFESPTEPFNLTAGSLRLSGARRSPKWNTDWTFEIEDIDRTRVIELAQPSRGWTVSKVVMNGVDVTDKPVQWLGWPDVELTVFLTRATAIATGRATDAKGQSVSDYSVYIFSQDPAKRITRNGVFLARSDHLGFFTVASLPAGSYFAAACPSVSNQERNFGLLQHLSEDATSVQVAADIVVSEIVVKVQDCAAALRR